VKEKERVLIFHDSLHVVEDVCFSFQGSEPLHPQTETF
jgi:hypothetical protein